MSGTKKYNPLTTEEAIDRAFDWSTSKTGWPVNPKDYSPYQNHIVNEGKKLGLFQEGNGVYHQRTEPNIDF